jgi:mono/diheme cytochrome c family protein
MRLSRSLERSSRATSVALTGEERDGMPRSLSTAAAHGARDLGRSGARMSRAPRVVCAAFVVVAAASVASLKAGNAAEEPLAARAVAILRKHCHECHGVKFKVPTYDVTKRETMVDREAEVGGKYLVAGKPAESVLLQRVVADEMPPGKRPKLSAEEKATLEAWIAGGVEWPASDAPSQPPPPLSPPPTGDAHPRDLPGGPPTSDGVPVPPGTQPPPTQGPPVAPPPGTTSPPSSGKPPPGAPDGALALEATAVLKKYCHQCHGQQFKVPKYDVTRRETMVGVESQAGPPLLVPGDPAASYVLQRIENGSMPPRNKPERPDPNERALLRRWIEAGAPFPQGRTEAARPFRSLSWKLTTLRDDLAKVRSDDRPYQRYFTFLHLWNNPAFGAEELAAQRAALSKVLNSLSWEPDVVVPRTVDPDGILLAVDLRALGWHHNQLWNAVLAAYPYGLVYDTSPADLEVNERAIEVSRYAESKVPVVRADWFCVTASRPPLYHTLLSIPATAAELEARLGVDVRVDFLSERLRRAGVTRSGVSRQNRIIDRHPSRYGAYWKSYDFLSEDGRGSILRFPLGPSFAENPFDENAFKHDGGEIIFSLPNGMQAYMLVDGAGARIDTGPTAVVFDSSNTGRSPEIVNGSSCIVCHQLGMQAADDVVRGNEGVYAQARTKVARLYAPRDEMRGLLEKDRARFLRANDAATRPFLTESPSAGAPPAEVLSRVIEAYVKDLGVVEAAAELGIERPEDLSTMVRSNRALRELGLAPLGQKGGTVTRASWDSIVGVVSAFQRAARELDLGRPYTKF